MAYDEKCYELAEYFLPHGSPADLMGLAQAIQDCVEMNTDVEIVDREASN